MMLSERENMSISHLLDGTKILKNGDVFQRTSLKMDDHLQEVWNIFTVQKLGTQTCTFCPITTLIDIFLTGHELH